MKKEDFTKLILVIMFLGFYMSSLVIITLENSKEDVGIFKILPIILLAFLTNFIRRRIMEKGESPTAGTVISFLILLLLPFINLFILYDIIKDKNSTKES